MAKSTCSLFYQRGRRSIQAPAVLWCLILVSTISVFYYTTSISCNPPSCEAVLSNAICHSSTSTRANSDPWDTSHYVKGPPRNRFQDNLRKDAFYITSWSNAGFTNQFISYVNMIYLGIISDRIPVVPPFAPDHHISPSAGPLDFGKIFNLTELRRSLRKPILEWSEVKALAPRLSIGAPSSVEGLGCWSTRPPDQKDPIRAPNLLHHLGLDVSYTRLPPHVRHEPALAANAHVALLPLAEKIFPWNPVSNPEDQTLMAPSPLGATLAPDHHMACFDLMYFASAGTQPYEWKTSWSPAWRFVGHHLKFTHPVTELAKQYVRKALRVTAGEIPPFIAVHARRGDFAHQCFDVPSQCLAPVSAYLRRVKEVQGSLFVKAGIKVTEVLMTSDETNPKFWSEVKEQGWKYIDHVAERTLDRHGEWYLPIIDIVAQSLGIGFVGSMDSTVSIVSARRVEDWNDGITRVVGWGGRDLD
ncbi:putative GDP-fucose protein O-fucosyltransferase [Lyophyllum shimeji]|uniref:GDP-fucose protein O-fucosyltransferase n=1 Tax=Lyophyllum shimeji TaxID=47721 RepID=A0A9P3UNK8_LYOSH|nr:putative GDP-fucose protein O-fucosyltransferase [Lyophyllum shimeji]